MIADADVRLLILFIIGVGLAGMGAWSFKNGKILMSGARPKEKEENLFLFWFMVVFWFGGAGFLICTSVYLCLK